MKTSFVSGMAAMILSLVGATAFAANLEIAFKEPVTSARDLASALQKVQKTFWVDQEGYTCSITTNIVEIKPETSPFVARATLWVALAPDTASQCQQGLQDFKREHLRSIPGVVVLD